MAGVMFWDSHTVHFTNFDDNMLSYLVWKLKDLYCTIRELMIIKQFNYMKYQATVDSHYDQNDSIAAFTNTSLYGLVTSDSGYFQVPISDFSGKCNQNNHVKFENKIPRNSCLQDLPYQTYGSFQNTCEKGFSVQKFVTNLFLAKWVHFFSSCILDSCLRINVGDRNAASYSENLRWNWSRISNFLFNSDFFLWSTP